MMIKDTGPKNSLTRKEPILPMTVTDFTDLAKYVLDTLKQNGGLCANVSKLLNNKKARVKSNIF